MKPSDYFRRQCWLGSSLVHRREIEMRHAIGVDKMMWGWDFPHIESADWLAPRDSIRTVMQGVPKAEVKAILAGNAAEAYGLDYSRLQPVAERIGPGLADLISA
jgi:predicted TIM-barrel fold metal-dependent hydrolase